MNAAATLLPAMIAAIIAMLPATPGIDGPQSHARSVGAWSDRPARTAAMDTMDRRIPDSVDVLMFAGFTAARAELRCGGRINVAGSAPYRIACNGPCTLTMTAIGDEVEIEGRRMPTYVVTPAAGDALTLSMNGRSKRVPYSLRGSARAGRLRLVARMATNDYLASTLAGEAAATDPIEYLAALAVLQRNYLAYHRDRHAPLADVCDNTHCQRSEVGGITPRIRAAVGRAARIELSAGPDTVTVGLPCYYSVCCGGATRTPGQIWNRAEPGYSAVICTHCRGSERYRWTRSFATTAEAAAIMRSAPTPPFVDDDFKIHLGRAVGFNKVLSNTIDAIERHGTTYVIRGRGFGHRVGMCQEGAAQLARHGWKADAILRFYFPAAHVSLRR